jgi:hypothetical protein
VIRYARSTDGGKSFSPAVTVAGADQPGARGWESLTLGYDGSVQLAWLDGRNAKPATHQHHTAPAGEKPNHMGAPRQDVFHASWKDDGSRTDAPVAANVCFCCKTAIATSGDRVYLAWRHIFPGPTRDIAFARSTDNGRTFGEPARVSEDDWKIDGCPDDGPAMVADGHGGIHITWPTLVPGDTPGKGIFYASLGDDQRFTPRLRLDAGDGSPAHPQIGSTEHTTVAAVWDEHAGDSRRIVFRMIENGAAQKPLVFSGQGFNYPVIASSDKSWIVLWSAQTSDGRAIIEGRRLPEHATP